MLTGVQQYHAYILVLSFNAYLLIFILLVTARCHVKCFLMLTLHNSQISDNNFLQVTSIKTINNLLYMYSLALPISFCLAAQ